MKRASFEQFGRRVMSGADFSFAGIALRLLLALLEPLYAALVTARNLLYDIGGFPSRKLPRPVVSVGNITSGGTGKTPVVLWLARKLRDAGSTPAVLLRGYKVGSGATSDEQVMLDRHLNAPGHRPAFVYANPNRLISSQKAATEHPEIDVFVLDDAFQHRQAKRDFDLVLINACDPFGYDHVHPRGLLREPLRGLRRAHAIVITRADQVDEIRLSDIERRIRQQSHLVPIYRANHAHIGLRSPKTPAAESPDLPMEELKTRRYFAFSGIGNPDSLHRQIESFGGQYVGHKWFADHHDYTSTEIEEIRAAAMAAGAEVILTTEKDWAKIAEFAPALQTETPIWRLELDIQFWGKDGDRLFEQIQQALARRPSPSPSGRGPG